jgi:RimJ/RimL family protein N-acetyltransferase
MFPERIEDNGLVLRRWVLSDAGRLQAAIAESASHLRPWVTWVEKQDVSIERTRAFIVERECDWRGGGSVLLGIFVGERIAGGCSLTVRVEATETAEIGYWLHPAFCGHGLATRAAGLLTDAALSEPWVQAVEIRHDRANAAAGRIPQRLGYRRVGHAPNPMPAPADSGTDVVWCQLAASQSLVLRLSLELVPSGRGGRRRPVLDGYRASMSFGQRRRGVEPVVHDAILVLEDDSMLAAGRRAVARAWVLMADELPRSLAVGSVLALLEGDEIVGRAEILTICRDPTPQPLQDLRAAKTRPLTDPSKTP